MILRQKWKLNYFEVVAVSKKTVKPSSMPPISQSMRHHLPPHFSTSNWWVEIALCLLLHRLVRLRMCTDLKTCCSTLEKAGWWVENDKQSHLRFPDLTYFILSHFPSSNTNQPLLSTRFNLPSSEKSVNIRSWDSYVIVPVLSAWVEISFHFDGTLFVVCLLTDTHSAI